jgi:peroxiredoxin
MNVRWIVAAVAAGSLATVALPVVSCGKAAPASKSEAASLDFTLTDMNGKTVNLAEFRGRPLIINFWATWCGPCKQEIPAFIELQNKYREQGFLVLGVSTDDPADALQKFAAEYQMNYPVLLATEQFMDANGPIWGIPVSILVRRDGTVYKKHMGPATKEEFEKDIKALM